MKIEQPTKKQEWAHDAAVQIAREHALGESVRGINPVRFGYEEMGMTRQEAQEALNDEIRRMAERKELFVPDGAFGDDWKSGTPLVIRL